MTYSPGVFYFATLPTFNASLLIIRGDISSLGHTLHNRSCDLKTALFQRYSTPEV